MTREDAEIGPDWRAALGQLRDAYAASTISRITDEFSRFERWCAAAGMRAMPTEPETVAAYVAASRGGVSIRTLALRLYVIRRLCQVLDLPDPTRTEAVRLALRREKRLRAGRPPRQARPLTHDLVERMRAACPPTILGLRDRALLSLGYDTLARRSELLRIRVEDVLCLPDGTAKVLIRREKQSLGSEGSVGYLSAQGLADVTAWLAAAGLSSGLIVRKVNHSKVMPGNPKPDLVALSLRRMALAAGLTPLDGRLFTSHSLRVGAVHDLARAGRSLTEIMRAGRWRNVERALSYTRDVPLNVWGMSEGDAYPLASRMQTWRRKWRTAPPAPRVVDHDAAGDEAHAASAGDGPATPVSEPGQP